MIAAPVGTEEVLKQYRESHGLKLAFQSGELIPLKGIHFRVSKVDANTLTLVPVAMTARRAKEKHHGR